MDSFNPLLFVIWATQLLLLGWDWSQDGKVLWSIPVIGSFFIIQVYMVWKTNYDKMMDEQRDAKMQALGGPTGVPQIDPSSTNLKDVYKTENNQPRTSNESSVNININADSKTN